MSERDKDFWDELFEFIKAGRVIPILGPELLWVEVDGARRTLYSEVADRLAERLKLPPSHEVLNPLDDVARRYVAQGGKRADIFKKIHLVMNELPFAVPDAIRDIARIEDFSLFVSLTFDTMLVRAIDQERFLGVPTTRHLAYALNRVDDLPSDVAHLTSPVVYSLLGRHTVGPDYVVTEEDTLEFISSLQSEVRRPQLLFDELARSNLLLLGCSFPDWLARFFIRTAKSRPLSQGRDEWEYWVDTDIESNPSLVLFLDRFSKSTRRISCNPLVFIEEMAREWAARQGAKTVPVRTPAQDSAADEWSGADSAPAVFLSYASQDIQAAERLNDGLVAAGIKVWFDKKRLEGGELFEKSIRTAIERCALFVPVLSRQTERRAEAFFRKEWHWADSRRLGIADSIPFIAPVVIDDTDPYGALAPDSFKAMQWMRVADGVADAQVVNRIRVLLREHVKRRPVH
ncbi:MAG: toll/interleukin-1 receptor domain-containing protein [Rhodoferax sp.]|jgi:hypothetical protein|nr:toll/interleukin-1 receptor domain-containing protein [Rhodoferax sp.]